MATPIETKRLILRNFTVDDWRDLLEISLDWKKAPGPEFDKWPTSDEGCRGLAKYFAENNNFFAMCLRDTQKVVGLVALNDIENTNCQDLGHVIHSDYQNGDVDREALEAAVRYIFENLDVDCIITHNAPHDPQLAPLRAIGFEGLNTDNPGELILSRRAWNTA